MESLTQSWGRKLDAIASQFFTVSEKEEGEVEGRDRVCCLVWVVLRGAFVNVK